MAAELLENLVQFADANHFKKTISKYPTSFSKRLFQKKYFLFKKYLTFHIRCWSAALRIVKQLTTDKMQIHEEHLWHLWKIFWMSIMAQVAVPKVSLTTSLKFLWKNSFREWKKLHFQEQSLTWILTLTDIHSMVINWQLKFNACRKMRKQYLTNMLNPYLLALLRLLLLNSKNGSFSCTVESSQLDFWTIINAFCTLNKF